MSTITVFEKIQKNIILQLKQAENRIRICVAWLTDDDIFEVLIEQATKGIYIEVIVLNDEYNRAKSNYHNRLVSLNSKVYLVDNNPNNGMLHHKFCLIDYFILISGSYNWTNNAKRNNENIIIVDRNNDEDSTVDEYNMFFKYDQEFDKILVQYGIEEEIDEDTGWDLALEYTNNQSNLFKEASDYYDLAINYIKNEDYNNALQSINESISISPIGDFYSLRHKIHRKKNMVIECCDDLFLYMKEVSLDDTNQIQKLKIIYSNFIDFVINVSNNYKYINEINNKTRVNLGSFAYLDIEPHFFTYEELEPPF